MARFAFIVVALPDDAPADEHALAQHLYTSYFPEEEELEDGNDLHFIVYNNLADVVADQAEGSARNGYWLTGEAGDVAPLLPPLLAA